MRAYFPKLVDRIEQEQKTASGMRRWLATFQLRTTRWCIRANWALLILGGMVLPVGAWASRKTDSIESMLNALAGSVIGAIVAVVACYGLRATK